MYTTHFGLTEPPFSITPDPRYVYMSERHREALAHLLDGIGETGGFVQLTGEIGTGKTTLSRCLLEQLPPERAVLPVTNCVRSRIKRAKIPSSYRLSPTRQVVWGATARRRPERACVV